MNKLDEILCKFKEIKIEADLSVLSDDIISALPYLKNAMDIITEIFLKQQNEELPAQYKKVMSSDNKLNKKFYSFFKGPYNEFENFKSEFSDINDRRKGCAFYPDKLDDCDIIDKINSLSEEDQNIFKDHFSIIREKDGKLICIPYHIYYKDLLENASIELKKAARIIKHKNLKNFLINRADTLLNGNYRECDSEWVRLTDSPIDILIGPYEVYADSLLGVKSTYESMLMIVDHEKCRALKKIENNLENIAELFPLPDNSKSAIGGAAPIVVVNQIYSAGEASSGVVPAAFNLPNDSWVRGNVGWKQVMLYNIMKAKFTAATEMIADKIIANREDIKFEPLFTFVLLHEISHGLGPAYRENGTEVSRALGSFYSAIEETKADSGALYLMLKTDGKFGIEKYDEKLLLTTYLASLFRSVRFGIHEAHGISNIIQLNWFLEKGNITVKNGVYSMNNSNILESAEKLLNKICQIESGGTEKDAESFIKRYGKPGNSLIKTIDSLKDIPIDIKPVFPDF